jgi:hypothetical protein
LNFDNRYDNVFHIVVNEGFPYRVTFRYTDNLGVPIDLSGYTAKMEVRVGNNNVYSGYDTPDVALVIPHPNSGLSPEDPDFKPGLPEVVNPPSQIQVGSDGKVTIIITGEETKNLMWNRGVYDVALISPSGETTKFLNGFFSITASATKV